VIKKDILFSDPVDNRVVLATGRHSQKNNFFIGQPTDQLLLIPGCLKYVIIKKKPSF
jgi:hypothetical protein